MQLLIFVLASYGLTLILLYGSIFNSVRPTKGKVGELFKCPLCMGFWTGAFILFISQWSELFTYEVNLANLLIMGWLSSGTSYFLDMIVDDHGFKVTRRIKNG
tara:strand:- start:410 stop:718 length:309 start_codon:yes stop_codon:yes gene_type:complete